MRVAVALAAVATVALAGCTFELRDPGVTVACGAMKFEVNRGDAGDAQVAAVLSGVERYGAVAGRKIVFLGETDASVADGARDPLAPVLIEFFWPDDAPTRYGFAEPAIVDGHYVGGFIYIHPMLDGASADMVTRLTMHELGHLAGLDDVDAVDEMMNAELTAADWGAGDIWGLHLTSGGC
jgi:hypothetical protein